MWTIGTLIFSLGVGVKMSLLLALPGIIMVLGQALETRRVLSLGGLMSQVQVSLTLLDYEVNILWLTCSGQVLLAIPFVAKNSLGYLSRAFEFSRIFLFKWTVNWRFLGEEAFLSRGFSVFLLTIHGLFLGLFLVTRWTRPSGLSILGLVKRIFKPLPPAAERQIAAGVTPDFVTTSILSSMAIGLLCARTLHYQFYAYIEWTTPFLLWRSKMHPIGTYAVWAAQEWAWNIFPSTSVSSTIVVLCLAIQVLGVWWGSKDDFVNVPPPPQHEKDTMQKKAK